MQADFRSEAVVLYLGRGLEPFPQPSSSRVRARFGNHADELMAYVESILDELRRIKPDWSVDTLESLTHDAVESVAREHPELSNAALMALAWYFSYGWK